MNEILITCVSSLLYVQLLCVWCVFVCGSTVCEVQISRGLDIYCRPITAIWPKQAPNRRGIFQSSLWMEHHVWFTTFSFHCLHLYICGKHTTCKCWKEWNPYAQNQAIGMCWVCVCVLLGGGGGGGSSIHLQLSHLSGFPLILVSIAPLPGKPGRA